MLTVMRSEATCWIGGLQDNTRKRSGQKPRAAMLQHPQDATVLHQPQAKHARGAVGGCAGDTTVITTLADATNECRLRDSGHTRNGRQAFLRRQVGGRHVGGVSVIFPSKFPVYKCNTLPVRTVETSTVRGNALVWSTKEAIMIVITCEKWADMKFRTRLWTSYVTQCSSHSFEAVSTAVIASISASFPPHIDAHEPQSRSVSIEGVMEASLEEGAQRILLASSQRLRHYHYKDSVGMGRRPMSLAWQC